MTYQPAKLAVIKAAAAILIVEILIFAIGVMPEHVAGLSSHDNCEICALIHHPPILQAGDHASDQLTLQSGLLSSVTGPPAELEIRTRAGVSRAPPSLIPYSSATQN